MHVFRVVLLMEHIFLGEFWFQVQIHCIPEDYPSCRELVEHWTRTETKAAFYSLRNMINCHLVQKTE